jgi:cytochrome c peroxidase
LGLLGSAAAKDQRPVDEPVSFSEDERRRILDLSPLGPPAPDPSNAVADDNAAAQLGQRLFFEKRLSSGGVACASCHVPHHAFADGKPLSQGVARGKRNTPSLWNVGFNRWFFWDGRADSLWSQALSPLESDIEMAGDRLQAAHLIAGKPELRSSYEAVFGAMPILSDPARFPVAGHPVAGKPEDPRAVAWAGMRDEDRVTVDRVFANLGKAIAAYERRLISDRSPFDRYVEALRAGHDDSALPASARRGLKLFVGRARCRLCHGGANFTDGEFPQYGSTAARRRRPYRFRPPRGHRTAHGEPLQPARAALGRESSGLRGAVAVSCGKPRDLGQFKTPSLRNVAKSAPYMHQGQFATLREVLEFYSTRAGTSDLGANGEKILKPLKLSPAEIDDLLAFLESLTDEAVGPRALSASRAPEPGDGPGRPR